MQQNAIYPTALCLNTANTLLKAAAKLTSQSVIHYVNYWPLTSSCPDEVVNRHRTWRWTMWSSVITLQVSCDALLVLLKYHTWIRVGMTRARPLYTRSGDEMNGLANLWQDAGVEPPPRCDFGKLAAHEWLDRQWPCCCWSCRGSGSKVCGVGGGGGSKSGGKKTVKLTPCVSSEHIWEFVDNDICIWNRSHSRSISVDCQHDVATAV